VTRARGFSLVELMIALALFGLIASGALALVMSASRTQAHSARVDVAQSGLRAGLDFMTRDIMAAGTGCRTQLMVGSSGVVVLPIIVSDNTGPNGSDSLELYTIDGTAQTGGTTPVPVALTVAAATGASSLTVTDATPFRASDLVMLTDLSNGVLIQLGNTAPAGTTLTATGANTFPAGISYPIPTTGTSYVFRVRHVTYAITATYGSTTSGNGYALTLDLHDGNGAQPLAEGVEDLQVALGMDNDASGDINTEPNPGTTTDEWIGNNSGDTAPVSLATLKAVRITLVAKSTAQEKGTFPARPLIEDHAAGTSDGFFRRVIRSEIAVRNFNI
jgi:prepilin-type N-terminal cleavage/methylation domain-containing protein